MKFLILLLVSICLGHPQPAEQDSDKFNVYIFFSEDCPICKYYIPEIKELDAKYQKDNLSITLVFPNFSSKPDDIKAFLKHNDLDIEYQTDYFKSFAKKYNITKTPEVLILNAQEEMIYKGRIDNSYHSIGKRRRVITSHDLNDFLSNIQRNKKVKLQLTEAIGCFINFSDI